MKKAKNIKNKLINTSKMHKDNKAEEICYNGWVINNILLSKNNKYVKFKVTMPNGDVYKDKIKSDESILDYLEIDSRFANQESCGELQNPLDQQTEDWINKNKESYERFMDAVDEFLEDDNYQLRIRSTFDSVRDMVLAKNLSYGNSVFEGIELFGEYIPAKTACISRISDKIKRLETVGMNDNSEDAISDLIGYLVALKLIIEDENYFESDQI